MTKKLLVTVDSLRYDYYDDMKFTKEYLGESHPDTYATFPATLGSFPAIMGGQYAERTGIESDDIFSQEMPKPRHGITSNHLLSPEYGYAAHFDSFTSPSGGGEGIREKLSARIPMGGTAYKIATAAFNTYQRVRYSHTDIGRTFMRADDMVEEFLEKIDGNDAWFGWLHFMEPHHPYEPDSIDVPRVVAQNMTRRVLAGRATPEEERKVRSYYQREVVELDSMLEPLWSSLDEDVEVVFTADHGEMLGEDEIWGHNGQLREELLRVPLATNNVDIESFGDLISLVDIPSIFTGAAYGQGNIGRDVAYALYGDERAVISTDAIITSSDQNTEYPELERKLSHFKMDGKLTRDDALQQDLEALGYA